MIFLLRLFISALVFLMFVVAVKLMQSQIKNSIDGTLRIIDDKLRLDSSFFNYKEKVNNLQNFGVLETNPRLAEPHYYLGVHFALLIVGAVLGYMVMPPLAILGGIIGWFSLDLYYRYKNMGDNEKMSEDVLMIFNVLSSQIKGGIYSGTALAECKDLITNKRLKRALTEFDRHLKVGDMTLIESLTELEEKFDNSDISALCLILKQNEESGRSAEVLNDLRKQIIDSEDLNFQKKKERMDRTMTIVMLLLFLDFMSYTLYIFVTSIFSQI